MRLQPMVRARLAGLGEAGAAWAAGLPALLDGLEERWQVRIERRSLPGGSAGLVARAVDAGGGLLAVKVGAPGEDLARQARVLAAAGGRGYVRLHGHDPGRNALLMERLGPSLDRAPRPVEESLRLLGATLRTAWTLPADVAPVLAPGEDKASTLHRLVATTAAAVAHDASAAVVERALVFAERRAAAYAPASCVVVHGDAHPANLLRVPETRAGAGSGWVLVDPDGFRADPAYDVGVTLRDWSSHLQDPGGAALLEGWCAVAAAETGQDEQAVWEWAFLERVSTGLYVTAFGARAVGRPFLTSAAALLA